MLQVFGNAQSPLGAIIHGVRKLFNPEGVKREEIARQAREDPLFAQQIARARRDILENMDPNAAANANVDISAPLLGALGLDPSDQNNRALLDSLEVLSPETFDEELDRRQVQSDLAETQVPAEIKQQEAAGATAGAKTAAQRNRQRFEQRRDEIGAPERTADLSLVETEQNVRHLQQQTMMNNFGLTDAALQDKIIRGYDAYRDTLPPEMQGIADTAFRNPNFLRHLQFMEQLDLERKMQLAKQSEDAVKMQTARIGLYSDVQDELEGAVEFINNPEIDSSVKRAALKRWNDMQLDLERNGFSSQAGMFTPVMLLARERGLIGDDIEAGAATAGTPLPTRGENQPSEGARRQEGREQAIVDPTRADLLEIAREQGVDRAIAVLQQDTPEMKAFRELMKERGELVELRRELRGIQIIEESGFGGSGEPTMGAGEGFDFSGPEIEPIELD